MKLLLAALLVAGSAVRARADSGKTSVQFAPPPFAMTNLIATDAVDGKGVDFMSMAGNGFALKSLAFGQGGSDKYWEKAGLSQGMAFNLIYGTLDSGGLGSGSDQFHLFGLGFNMPFNVYFDPLSKEADDNSLPIYFGLHFGMNEMFGSLSFETQVIDHYDDTGPPFYIQYPVYKTVTDTMSLAMLGLTVGWQVGIQWGVNLGDDLKFIPYLNLSQDVYVLNLTTISTVYSGFSSSSSSNIGPLPITPAPGFDIILRKIGMSLGGAFQTTKQVGGDMKQFSLHLRWSEHFTSLCGL